MVEGGIEYQLKLVTWDFFGTLTWNNAHLGSARTREFQAWEFFREWTRELQVRLALVPIVVRWEKGEWGERPHAHFLLKQFPIKEAFISQCFWHMHQWSSINGYGFARIRLYNAHNGMNDDGYVAKCLECTQVQLAACESNANKYELGKFSYCDRLVINPAARRVMIEAAHARVGNLSHVAHPV
jgi:hypothetical protein